MDVRAVPAEVDQIAYGLIGAGVRPGDLVGIAVGRSPEMIAAIYGIARAGAACVPLDVTYPPERIAAMLAQAQTGPGHRAPAARRAGRRPRDRARRGGLLAPADRRGGRCRCPGIRPDDLLYVLFTSGSTGPPKGVAMSHAALDNYQAWQTNAPGGGRRWSPCSTRRSASTCPSRRSTPRSAPAAPCRSSTSGSGGTCRLLRLLDREAVERVFLPYVALQQLAEAASARCHPRALAS